MSEQEINQAVIAAGVEPGDIPVEVALDIIEIHDVLHADMHRVGVRFAREMALVKISYAKQMLELFTRHGFKTDYWDRWVAVYQAELAAAENQSGSPVIPEPGAST